MARQSSFNGFTKKTASFFRRLAKNNTKEWFDAHKAEYEEHVLEPSRLFVLTMGDKLSKIAPKIVAEPKVNKSLFRIHRDTRFSKDKSPYKTHLGIWMWEGPLKRMENSGFYFHLEPGNMMLGVGIYMFPKEHLVAYRDSVVHPQHGAALSRVINSMDKAGYPVGGQHYKMTPRGYDKEHKRAPLLLHNGLWAGFDGGIPDQLYSGKIVDFCFSHYKKMLPLHKWLKAMTERMV